MARMMRDGHLGFAHLREIDPPKTPRISGRYLDRWVGVWENACNVPDAFQRMARDLGEFLAARPMVHGRHPRIRAEHGRRVAVR